MWDVIALLSLILMVLSTIGLFLKKHRPKAKWSLPISLLAAVVAIVAAGDQNSRNRGFIDASDMRRAKEAGITDPEVWQARRAEIEREEADRVVEERAAREAKEAEEEERRAAMEALRTPPPDQQALLEVVLSSRVAYNSASNDMAKGAARPQRASAICSAVSSPNVSGWIGKIADLSSNNEGKGVLSVDIGDNVSVGTWNNAFSDIVSNTLIDSNSSVFQAAIKMAKGQYVRFSGRFFISETDCFQEKSMTLNGSISKPEFLFRFSDIDIL